MNARTMSIKGSENTLDLSIILEKTFTPTEAWTSEPLLGTTNAFDKCDLSNWWGFREVEARPVVGLAGRYDPDYQPVMRL